MGKISITWRLVLSYMVVISLIILLALLSSCGTHKKIVDTEFHEVEQVDKSTSDATVRKESETSESSSTKVEKAIVKENQSTKTTEEFNPDGTLNKRTTETSNKKTTDNSKKEKNDLKKSKMHVDSIITTKIYRKMLIQDKKMHSNLDKDSTWIKNIGGKNIAFGLAILAVVLVVYNNWPSIKGWLKGKLVR